MKISIDYGDKNILKIIFFPAQQVASHMFLLQRSLIDALHLFYPHHCCGCGSDVLAAHEQLCFRCVAALPHTAFERYPDNPVEKIFRGRSSIRAAHSEFYFSKGQLIQQLIHQLKYNSNKEIGLYLGKMMGRNLLRSGRFGNIDYIVPLPMFPDKEFKRGYNQATIIGNGMSETMNVPVLNNRIIRRRPTESQTKKHRAERWENVADSFDVVQPASLAGKNFLLVDDVLTTGATLDACCQSMRIIPASDISIATLAIASK